jgi:hypothetical protein
MRQGAGMSQVLAQPCESVATHAEHTHQVARLWRKLGIRWRQQLALDAAAAVAQQLVRLIIQREVPQLHGASSSLQSCDAVQAVDAAFSTFFTACLQRTLQERMTANCAT